VRYRSDVWVYECEYCGHRVMVDTSIGEQPPDEDKYCDRCSAPTEPAGAGGKR